MCASLALAFFPLGIYLIYLGIRVKTNGADAGSGAYLLKGLIVLGFVLSFYFALEAFKLIFVPSRSGFLHSSEERAKTKAEAEAIAQADSDPTLECSPYPCPKCGGRLAKVDKTDQGKDITLVCQHCGKKIKEPPKSLALAQVKFLIPLLGGLVVVLIGVSLSSKKIGVPIALIGLAIEFSGVFFGAQFKGHKNEVKRRQKYDLERQKKG